MNTLNSIGVAGIAACLAYMFGLIVSWIVMDAIDREIVWLKKRRNLLIIFLTPLIPAFFAALAMI